METGEITPMVISPKDLGKYRQEVHGGKRQWVPLIELPQPKKFSALLGDMMCETILGGGGILKACDAVGITYREYCQWRKLYPEFQEMIDEARKDRAEVIFDKIERVAEETGADEDEIGLGRLKVDIYKYVSEVTSSERFGRKTQINAKVSVGAISVETGIRRVGDDGYVGAPTDAIFSSIEEQQKKIEAQDLNMVPALMPTHLPKKVDEL